MVSLPAPARSAASEAPTRHVGASVACGVAHQRVSGASYKKAAAPPPRAAVRASGSATPRHGGIPPTRGAAPTHAAA